MGDEFIVYNSLYSIYMASLSGAIRFMVVCMIRCYSMHMGFWNIEGYRHKNKYVMEVFMAGVIRVYSSPYNISMVGLSWANWFRVVCTIRFYSMHTGFGNNEEYRHKNKICMGSFYGGRDYSVF